MVEQVNGRTLEVGAATALVGVGIFQIHGMYTQHAGSLHDVRQSSSQDADAHQCLRDADILAGGMTLLAGGALSLAIHQAYPLVIAGVAYGLVATYYHVALQQPEVTAPAYAAADTVY